MLKAPVPSAPGKGQRSGLSPGPCAWPHALHRNPAHPLAERTPGPAFLGSWEPRATLPLPGRLVSGCGSRVGRLSACFLFTVSPSCCFLFSSFSPGNYSLPHLLFLSFPSGAWRPVCSHVTRRSSYPSAESVLSLPEPMVPASGSEVWRKGLGRTGACLSLAVVLHGTAVPALPCSVRSAVG